MVIFKTKAAKIEAIKHINYLTAIEKLVRLQDFCMKMLQYILTENITVTNNSAY